jgi:hypothetical protein
VPELAPENLFHLQRDKVEIHALGNYRSIQERLHPIVGRTRERKPELAHKDVPPPFFVD